MTALACHTPGLNLRANAAPASHAALLFHSITPTGALERKSLHASCPVVRGTKWTAAKWIRTGRYLSQAELVAAIQARAQQHMDKQAAAVAALQQTVTAALAVATQRR